MIDRVQLQRIWQKVVQRNRTCMYSNCKEQAIKSHVLQKNGIIREIAVDNHLIDLKPPHWINADAPFPSPRKVGVNDVYTFRGFCNTHDTEIFRPIESGGIIDFESALAQILFSYRALCQELRRKETALEFEKLTISFISRPQRQISLAAIDGHQIAISRLNFFKTELEHAIDTQDYSNFEFTTTRIHKIDLCISVAISVKESSLNDGITYEEWSTKEKTLNDPIIFVNVIPFHEHTYFIIGCHRHYPNPWVNDIVAKLRTGDRQLINKELSDLITLRLEFWAMSPLLFSKIPEDVWQKYQKTFLSTALSFSPTLKADFNLFESMG